MFRCFVVFSAQCHTHRASELAVCGGTAGAAEPRVWMVSFHGCDQFALYMDLDRRIVPEHQQQAPERGKRRPPLHVGSLATPTPVCHSFAGSLPTLPAMPSTLAYIYSVVSACFVAPCTGTFRIALSGPWPN